MSLRMVNAGKRASVATESDKDVMIGMTTLSGFSPRLKAMDATARAKREIRRKLERLENRATPTRKGRLALDSVGLTIRYVTTPKTMCIIRATASILDT